MAKIVKEAFRKPFSVAAQSGGSASADAAAVPLVDGRADDHTEKIRQTCGAAGIYGMILCKTENFSEGFDTLRTCAFRQYNAGSAGLKDSFGVWHTDRPLKKHHKKPSCKSHPRAALQHGHYDECRGCKSSCFSLRTCYNIKGIKSITP